MRGLSNAFMTDLKEGILKPILERVQQDDTLMLAIRKNYINIYYRGGSILKLEETKTAYEASFDTKYNTTACACPALPSSINSIADAKLWCDAFQNLKGIMDCWFSKHRKAEREFQQLVVRENNCSTISGESEYFITDIEFANSTLNARFDMLALRWLASDRKNTTSFVPALIEMKYGDDALEGKSGIVDHLKSMDKLINSNDYSELLKMIQNQFNQMDELGLLHFNRTAKWSAITVDATEKPEVIFIFANHNPRSPKLGDILNSSAMEEYANPGNFDLKFYVSKFAGYGLHADCMLDLDEFRKICK